jgi:hypothetical protein
MLLNSIIVFWPRANQPQVDMLLALGQDTMSELNNMSTCDWLALGQDTMSELSNMSTCDWLALG